VYLHKNVEDLEAIIWNRLDATSVEDLEKQVTGLLDEIPDYVDGEYIFQVVMDLMVMATLHKNMILLATLIKCVQSRPVYRTLCDWYEVKTGYQLVDSRKLIELLRSNLQTYLDSGLSDRDKLSYVKRQLYY
jgi:hypothetical protein